MPLHLLIILVRGKMYLRIIFLIMTINYGNTEQNENEVSRLIKMILKSYDVNQSPVNETTYLPVQFFMYIFKLEMIDEDVFRAKGNIVMRWTDSRLSWDPSKHFNITHLLIVNNDIWQPTPALVHTINSVLYKIQRLDPTMGKYARCTSKGNIHLFYNINIYLRNSCSSDFRNWPHDSKICQMKLAFLSTLGQNITLSSIYNRVPPNKGTYFTYTNWQNKLWKINSATGIKKEKNETESNEEELHLTLYLKRNGSLYSAFYFQPCLVNLAITLALFWLDPKSPERIALIGLLLITQSMFFISMTIDVPSLGDQTPFLMFIISFAFFLTVTLFVVTILSRRMISTTYNPIWLDPITAWSVSSPIISRFFFLNINPKMAAELIEEEDEEGSLLIMKTKKLQKQWQIATQILNSLLFILFVPISMYLTVIYSSYM